MKSTPRKFQVMVKFVVFFLSCDSAVSIVVAAETTNWRSGTEPINHAPVACQLARVGGERSINEINLSNIKIICPNRSVDCDERGAFITSRSIIDSRDTTPAFVA